MILSSLSLFNFRSYAKRTFSFSPSKTILLGENTKGKTNLLEAVYLLSLGKSFRAEKEGEMIKWGESVARVKGRIEEKGGEKKELEVVLTKGEVFGRKVPAKKFFLNQVRRRLLDFAGSFPVVLFWPEDLLLVTGPPSLRRRYLDAVLVQVDREYRRCLFSYEKGLRQRNKILAFLREKRALDRQLFFWDQLLIKNGIYLTQKREEYLNFLNRSFLLAGGGLSPKYHLVYEKNLISAERLAEFHFREIEAGVTLVGPHRDDFRFQTEEGGWDLSHFGSRGEQRMAIIWLKLGEKRYLLEETGEQPIFLLDDIFSELDERNREIVFANLQEGQTIITTTEEFLKKKEDLGEVQILSLA